MLFGSKTQKIAKAVAKKKADVLIKLTKDKDPAIRLAAMKGLGDIKSNDGFSTMTFNLNDPDPAIRAAAAEGLGTLGDVHGKAHITFRMNKETDPKALEAMHKAVSILKDY